MMNHGMEVIILITTALGVLFLALAIRRLRQHRLVSAGARGVTGAFFLALSGLVGSIALNLLTYQRLTFEQPVATLSFSQMAPEQYQVLLRSPDGRARLFTLVGDEWQLDARVLKWHGAANILGLDAQFRLERISGRYRDVEQARAATPSLYSLAEPQGLDLWAVSQDHPAWIPFVDAIYGSATYMPMAHQARFEVTMTQSGLIARPANPTAEQALGRWGD